jgi:hypothetical protein
MTPGICNPETLPEIHPERHHPFSNTDPSNEYHKESSDEKEPVKEIVMILFIIVPAGVIFLYLLVHAIRECLMGCFY